MTEGRTTEGRTTEGPSEGRRVVALVALGVLVLGGVVFGPRVPEGVAAPPEPTTPTAPAPAPRPAPAPPPTEPEVTDGQRLFAERYGREDPEALGVRFESDSYPPIFSVFEPGYDFIADEGERWRYPDHFVTPPSARIEGEPFVEDTVVVREPAPCYAFHRRVRGVDVGIPGEVGRRMEATLLGVLAPHEYASVGPDEVDDFGCTGIHGGGAGKPFERGALFVSDLVVRVACDHPELELRCFSVTRWWTDGSMVPPWEAEYVVFDRSTGERLPAAALHPRVSEEEFTILLRLIMCAVGGFKVSDDVLDPDVPGIEYGEFVGPTLMPDAEGLAVEWLSPFDKRYALYGERIVIPWEVVRLAEAPFSMTPPNG